MNKEISKDMELTFNPEDGKTTCVLNYDNKQFFGYATCANDDMDMVSKKTGEEIAIQRAKIAVLQYEKNMIESELRGLKSLYFSIKHSRRYNPKSYEAKMLQKQMHMREEDIAGLKDEIKETRLYLKHYIDLKDSFYQQVRKLRKREQLEKEQGNED